MVYPLNDLFWGCDEECPVDPGKDLFALLFLSFFLISTLLVLVDVGQSERVSVQRVGTGDPDDGPTLAAWIDEDVKGLVLVTDAGRWRLPQEVARVREHLGLLSRDRDVACLLVAPPGEKISGIDLLAAVGALQRAEICTVFRPEGAK